MAILISRSRNFNHFLLSTRFRFLSRLNQTSSKTFSHHAKTSSFTTAAGGGFTKPTATFSGESAAVFRVERFQSNKTGEQLNTLYYEEDNHHQIIDENQVMDFPGGQLPITPQMKFIAESSEKRLPCYRVLDDDGYPIPGSIFEEVSKELAVKMYSSMVTLQVMDTIFYEAQRQGRLSFYLTTAGEEGINIASAAALSVDDFVLPQYREVGVILWRGFPLKDIANQLFGNKFDYGKGRQMPCHHGSNELNYLTISSPIATQIPQAAGVAYSLKMDKKEACAITYLGDGSTSEGDFHAALNFAAVLDAPVVFICRNNGWAISTPVNEQFRSDGVASKGQAYGIRSIRVDGNDVLATHSAIRAAREMAIKEQKPILVEAMTYRVAHHSTSDDSTKYRPVEEIEHWKTAKSPISRFRKWIQRNGWWNDENESELRGDTRKQVLQVMQAAEKVEKPPLTDLFTDVYDKVPLNLQEQHKFIRDAVKKSPREYPSDVPI
ncbi:2-oxoisovalerate dehydrogenase subunit alpha 1, mitochondrial isoform X1 [Nicotiana tabacum]|uniref:3-methyl-2-oxobutanoate dehydrogenase (2-methylpropanoyl-transferring) n=2 Tax=Nicotiana TaxID=4085 RepID=A0A1S4B8Q2_TOBAC|nr:PREDICTED: 2-oxoisovalerate dehydrogenase subunit alpha 1, mitochondrial-like isoform X1 [Nicotiana sylvestris]XP_016485227.1 PREDICTED: 2-oxoisovalerate dehydrogenase subunit alpha 1, mitochondrial-like isoform X1 [Nicotiana tabacum]